MGIPVGYAVDDDRTRLEDHGLMALMALAPVWSRWQEPVTDMSVWPQMQHVAGVYDGSTGAMVGFVRVHLEDQTSDGYFVEAFVIGTHRRQRLGSSAVETMTRQLPDAQWKWMLRTQGPEGVYERYGFAWRSPAS